VSWIISVLVAIPALFLGGAFIIGGFSFLHGILFFLYAAFLEYSYGATIGKQIVNLKVRTTQGTAASLDKTLVRNISKIHWILWLVDTIIGMATVGDTHQKFSDRYIGTTVVSTIATGLIIHSSMSPPARSA